MRQLSLIEKSELLSKALALILPAGSFRIASVEYCLARDPALAAAASLPCFRRENPSVNVFFDASVKRWPYPRLGIPVFPPALSEDFGKYRRLVELYRNDVNLIPVAAEDFAARFPGKGDDFADLRYCVRDLARQCEFKLSESEDAGYGKADVARMAFEVSALARSLPAGHPARAETVAFFKSLDAATGGARKLAGVTSMAPAGDAVRGTARVIDGENPEPIGSAYNRFDPGDVLLARNTTVRYMRYLVQAGAVVTVNPNKLSHASIVCAELGKPCVLGVGGLLCQVFDGDEVLADPRKATVEILRRFYERG